MLVALGTVMMSMGAVFEVIDLTVCAVASLLVVLVHIEIGSPYTWLIWICTSLATAIMFSGSPVWSEYLLVFGVYPIIKAYIEKLKRPLWWPVKIAYINAVIWVLLLLVEGVIGIPVFEAESDIIMVALYVVINVAFVVYDMFITAMVRLYIFKWRRHFSRFFK